MSVFYTDAYFKKADLDPRTARQVLADAERVHRYVKRNEGITEPQLRQYGERNGLPPDRLNAALDVLQRTDRLLHVTADDG